MERLSTTAFLIAAALLGLAGAAHGQATTGSIAGRVHSSDGLVLPGVTATLTSPMLQGSRTTMTSDSGDYLIPLLPPGVYSLVFELDGFQTIKRTQQAAGGYNATVDVTMSPAVMREEVTVVADAQPLVETAQVATNIKQSLMAALPSNRTIDAVLLMTPGLHATGPRGAYTINGSQSYENVYTIDGAIINENLRGAPMNPYIEDALQEVTVATAGVSAEYGRFSGGIANAVTKSGGDTFSGTFRTSFANERWRTYTPFETTQRISNPTLKLKADRVVPTYEATFGGPIAKERLWFFSAVRNQQQESTRTTFTTNIPYTRTNDEKRYEGKLTYTPASGHSLRGSYLYMDQVLRNNTGSTVMDLQSLTNQGQPQNLYSVHYSGVLRPNLFLETQYSARHLTFTDVGATTRDQIKGTMILDMSRSSARFWSPTFCSGSTCDGDEQRNNSNFFVKASSFLPTRSLGTHHVVFGYDYFNDNIWANTHATGSDYRIRATTSLINGDKVYPVFVPGNASTSTIIEWTPITQLSEGSNLRTHAAFVNDTWRFTDRFTFGLGMRFDRNQATDGSGTNVGDTMNFSPRLSAVWDLTGDSRWSVSGSAARYVMALTSNLAGSTTAAGNAANYRWFYEGPAVNTSGPVVETAAALQQVFDWFFANGGTGRKPYVSATVPGFNMTMPEPLKSPYAVEYAGGLSRTLGRRGSLRVDGVFRDYRNLYSQRTDLTTGKVVDAAGNRFDGMVVENTNQMRRRYAGLITQATYSSDRVSLGGNYTLSRAYGNVEAETVNGGPSGASINHYPEYRRAEWNYPDGDLSIDQRHRARGWATYSMPVSRSAGTIDVGLVQQIGSGVPYGALGVINPVQFMANPGYAIPPGQIEYFFTARDAFRTEATFRTDLSLNYSHRLYGTAHAFFHGEILNIFNQFQLCGCGDTVFNNGGITNMTTIGQSVIVRPVPFNPYTTQPVQGVNWDKHANFGQPTSTFAFTTPRLYRFSVGVRF